MKFVICHDTAVRIIHWQSRIANKRERKNFPSFGFIKFSRPFWIYFFVTFTFHQRDQANLKIVTNYECYFIASTVYKKRVAFLSSLKNLYFVSKETKSAQAFFFCSRLKLNVNLLCIYSWTIVYLEFLVHGLEPNLIRIPRTSRTWYFKFRRPYSEIEGFCERF